LIFSEAWRFLKALERLASVGVHRLEPGLIVGLGGHLVWVVLVSPFSSDPTVFETERGWY